MDRVRLGFVGAGFMGQLAHLVNFARSPLCEVVALAEKRPKLAQAVASNYQIQKVYDSHLALCEDPTIDAVAAITADDLHAPVAIDLMNAGKHVFIEKPMATNRVDARTMVETAEKNRVRLMVGYMKRYDPGVELAKQIIDGLRQSGELGPLTFVRSHCFGGDWVCNVDAPITTDEAYPETVSRNPAWMEEEQTIRRFRTFNNVFCHDVNLLRYLVGEIRTILYANLTSPAQLVVFDLDGVAATLEVGHISAGFWDEELKLYFQDGWVHIKTPPPLLKNVPAQIEVYKARQVQQVCQPRAAWEWAFKRSAEHFLQCVLENREPRSGGADSLRDMEIIEGLFERFDGAPKAPL